MGNCYEGRTHAAGKNWMKAAEEYNLKALLREKSVMTVENHTTAQHLFTNVFSSHDLSLRHDSKAAGRYEQSAFLDTHLHPSSSTSSSCIPVFQFSSFQQISPVPARKNSTEVHPPLCFPS